MVSGSTLGRSLYRPATGPLKHTFFWFYGWTRSLLLSLLIRSSLFGISFWNLFLESLLLWLYFLVIECKGGSCDCLLDHVIFFMVIFYGYMLRSMESLCMSTFSIRPFLFGFYPFDWLMLQSMESHALPSNLLGGLLGLLLFPTSAFL